MIDQPDFRDPWRERIRLFEAKRQAKNRARKERKAIPEGERMPWPDTAKIALDEVWRRRG
jgi:hypothetical protein